MRLLFTERLVIEIDLKVFEERLDENRAHIIIGHYLTVISTHIFKERKI